MALIPRGRISSSNWHPPPPKNSSHNIDTNAQHRATHSSNSAIQEYSFSVNTSAVISTAVPYPQTYLSAFYDTVGSRNIVYQTPDYNLHVFNVNSAAGKLSPPPAPSS